MSIPKKSFSVACVLIFDKLKKKILKKRENLFVWNEFFFTFALPIKGMAA